MQINYMGSMRSILISSNSIKKFPAKRAYDLTKKAAVLYGSLEYRTRITRTIII